MRNNSMIAVYSNIITAGTTRYTQEFERDGGYIGAGPSEVEPTVARIQEQRLHKYVFNVGAVSDEHLKRKFRALYPHLNIHKVQQLGDVKPHVQADVCVHVDDLINEIMDIRINIRENALRSSLTRQHQREVQLWSQTYNAEVDRRKAFNDLPWYKKIWYVIVRSAHNVDCV